MAMGIYTQNEIAAMVGVRPQEVSRWKKDAEFQAYFEDSRREIFEPLNAAIRSLRRVAIKKLYSRLTADKADPDETRLIDMTLKLEDAPAIDKSSHDKIKELMDGIKSRNS